MKVRTEADLVGGMGAAWFWRVAAGLWAFAVVLLIAATPSPAAETHAGTSRDDVPDITGRYIVLLKDSVVRPGRLAERHSDNRDARITSVYRHAIKGYAAEIPSAELSAIRQDPNVVLVEPDAVGSAASQTVPTGIDRIFATSNDAIDIDERDDRRVDVNVAVLDSGIDEHPDLNVVGRVDCSRHLSCEEGGFDGYGHGTHVAGTIGALDNGEGVVGVAPGARLWAVKVLDSNGYGVLSELIAAVDWITATREDGDPKNDIEVANESLGYSGIESSALFEYALDASIDAGIVHVAAAGNDHQTVRYIPGVEPDEITVSSVADYDGKPGEAEDQLANFSNFGNRVDVAAPGVEILSTTRNGGYGQKSGTSMASPHVAGAAAILASENKPESRKEVEAIRNRIVAAGNFNWGDTSGDGTKEPLLDVSDETTFAPTFVEPTNQNWRIEGSTLAELGAWEPYASLGTFKTEFKSGLTAVVIECATSGSGTLGLEEAIALTGCKTKLNGGAPAAACAPANTSINLAGDFKTTKATLVVFQLGSSECSIGKTFELKPGSGFTLKAGPEAVNFAAQMSATSETQQGKAATVSITSTMSLTGKYEGSGFGYQ